MRYLRYLDPPHPKKLIGICGRKQTGKTSTTNVLVDRYGFVEVSWAEPLKRLALAANPYIKVNEETWLRLRDIVDEKGWEVAKRLPETRRFLQELGTEGARSLWGEEVWFPFAWEHFTADSLIVVSDVRFENEADKVRQLGGQIWRIFRPGFDNQGDEHESESGIDAIEYDLALHNDEGLEDLPRKVDAVILGISVIDPKQGGLNVR
jgi:hypothetical protein